MTLKNLLFTLFSLFCLTINAQNFKDIKNVEISNELFLEENRDSLMTNIYTFVGEDFDSTDIEVLTSDFIFKMLVIGMISNNDIVNYDLLYYMFLEYKSDANYPVLKEKILLSLELFTRPADYQNWKIDKLLITDIFENKDEVEDVRKYLKKHSDPNKSYKEFFVDYSKYIDEQEIKNKPKESTELLDIFIKSTHFDEKKALEESRKVAKPIILFFTGYNCIKCRKVEQSVLFDNEISKFILQNFLFYPIYVDEKTELPAWEQNEIIINGQPERIKTIGSKYLHYQSVRFQVSEQPYFVILNEENEVLGVGDFSTKTVTEFKQFLKTALEK